MSFAGKISKLPQSLRGTGIPSITNQLQNQF